jgi:hypothetical protein
MQMRAEHDGGRGAISSGVTDGGQHLGGVDHCPSAEWLRPPAAIIDT